MSRLGAPYPSWHAVLTGDASYYPCPSVSFSEFTVMFSDTLIAPESGTRIVRPRTYFEDKMSFDHACGAPVPAIIADESPPAWNGSVNISVVGVGSCLVDRVVRFRAPCGGEIPGV